MKQVAGSMKLDLAQYRELAAFAQFGSDLDKATQDILARGARLTELLKQPQYEPLTVSQQVMQIYAAMNKDDPAKRGWLREIPVVDISRWGKEFLEFCAAKFPQIEKRLATDLKFPEVNRAASDPELNKAITEFNAAFAKTPGAKL